MRALELSQNAPLEDASSEEQAELEKTAKPAAPATPPAAAPVKSASNEVHATDGTIKS
jgi:hypothetical protein